MSSSIPLIDLSLGSFAEALGAPSEPGAGGSAAAAVAALGASLVSMAYRVAAGEDGNPEAPFVLGRAEELEDLRDLLLELVDRDAAAWNRLVQARASDKDAGPAARNAVETPLEIAEFAVAARRLLAVGRAGVPERLASDLDVADACLVAAVNGALSVVETNLAELGEDEPLEALRQTVETLRAEVRA